MAGSEDSAPARKKLDDLLKMARARGKETHSEDPAPSAAVPVALSKLPLWPDAVRAVPNGFLRSALFGIVAKGKRRYIDGEQLAALDGIDIQYTGQRLDQSDLDVWESVLQAVRLQELGSQCRLTSYALLKLMGLTDTGKNRTTLHKRITRLVASALTVKQGRYTYIGSLISFAAKDEDTREWVIELDPRLRPLFDADQFTQIEWTVRHELNGQQIAQWLHGFYASHAKPFQFKVETLLKLCGSEDASPTSGRQKLRKALNAVAEASTAHGQPFSYDIRGDLVHVQKLAIGTQRRHLTKKTSTPRKPRG